MSRTLQARKEVSYCSAPKQVLGALVFVFPFFDFFLGSAASLLGTVAGRFASSLLFLAATLLGSFRSVRAQAHPRKRITSRVTPRLQSPPFSPRFQGVLFSKVLRALCFRSQISNTLGASLTRFRSAYDIVQLRQFTPGLLAFTPSGAGSGASLCRFLVSCT